MDQFFQNFSSWTEPIHWVLDRNYQKFWLNGLPPLFHTIFPCTSIFCIATLEVKILDKDKEDVAKIGTLRISNTSSKLHRDSRELHKDHLDGNSSYYLFGDCVELTVVINVAQRFCFCWYLYLVKLLSLTLCMILLAFVNMLLLNSVCSPIQQARWLMSALASFDKPVWKLE